MIKYFKKHRRASEALIVAGFLALSVLIALPFMLMAKDQGIIGSDFSFHYMRLREIADDLLNGHLPLINLRYSYPEGIADNTFYPWITLVPLALAGSLIKSPIILYFVGVIAIQATCFIVAYVSYKTADSSRIHGVIFSLIYGTTIYLFNNIYFAQDFGADLGISLLPLAVFGFIALIKRGRWLMLTVGMILIVYSHVLTAYMAVGLLVVMLIAFLNRFDKRKIKALLLAVAVTVIATSLYWLPLLHLSLRNKIYLPFFLPSTFPCGLFNYSDSPFGLILPILAIIGFCSLKKPTRLDGVMLIVVILTVIINIKLVALIAWFYLKFIRIFQFSNRFSEVGNLCSSWLVVRMLSQPATKRKLKVITLVLLAVLPIINISEMTNWIRNDTASTRHFRYFRVVNYGKFNKYQMMNNKELRFISHRFIYDDYSPRSAVSDATDKYNYYDRLFISKRRPAKATVKATRHGIVVRTKRTYRNIYVPIIVYHGIHYRFKLNGRTLRRSQINQAKTWKYQRLNLKNLPRGRNHIAIKSAKF